ncbi:unnamed protein product, partial [Musa acuminata subsp. malaccensis]
MVSYTASTWHWTSLGMLTMSIPAEHYYDSSSSDTAGCSLSLSLSMS